MKKAFTLTELVIVVAIIAITSVFSFGVWRYGLVKAEFDGVVSEIIGIFQDARGYAVKNVEVGGANNAVYIVANVGGVVTLSGDVSGVLDTYDFTDVVEFSSDWESYYEAPYADFSVLGGGDLEFTMSSVKGDMSQDIIVHDLSGIAEEE